MLHRCNLNANFLSHKIPNLALIRLYFNNSFKVGDQPCTMVKYLTASSRSAIDRHVYSNQARINLANAMFRCCRRSEPDMCLTAKDKIIVHNDWLSLRNSVTPDDIGTDAIMAMFKNYPETKKVFTELRDHKMKDLPESAVLKDHALKVASVLDKCVLRLNNLEAFALIVADEGGIHRDMNIHEKHLRCMTNGYIKEIKRRTKYRWDSGHQRAWERFFELLIVHLLTGIGACTPKEKLKK